MKLRPYPAYKPSGVDWLGDVPEHWEASQLRRKAHILDCKHRTVPFIDDGIPLASIREVHGMEVDLTDAKQTSEEEYLTLIEGDRRPRLGDIIYSRNATVGDAALVTKTERFCMGQDVCLIRSPKHHPRFLLYLLHSAALSEQVESLMIGSTFRRINVGQIHGFWICVPPLPEQRSIAAFLDRETGRVDRLVAKKRELIERLKEKRTALISRTVTRGLPPAAARAAGLPENPPLKPSGVEWLGDIPKHWEARRLKDAGTLKGGAGFPHEEQGLEDEELPFYKVGDLKASLDGRVMTTPEHSISKETARKLRAAIIPAESIVYAKIGAALLLNRRRVTFADCCIDNNMTAYLPDKRRVRSEWAFYWLSILDFGEFMNPGAVPSFSEGYQAILPVLLPPLPEQAAIAAYLDDETAKLDALMGKVEEAVERLQEYRTALITAAVTGKIDVRGAGILNSD